MTCPNLPASLPKAVPSPLPLSLSPFIPVPALYQCSFLHFPQIQDWLQTHYHLAGTSSCEAFGCRRGRRERGGELCYQTTRTRQFSVFFGSGPVQSGRPWRGNGVDSVRSPSPSCVARVENSSTGLGTRWKLSWHCELAGSFPVERPGVNQGPSQWRRPFSPLSLPALPLFILRPLSTLTPSNLAERLKTPHISLPTLPLPPEFLLFVSVSRTSPFV